MNKVILQNWPGWPDKVTVNCTRCGNKGVLNNPKQVYEMVGPSTRPLNKVFTDHVSGHLSCLQCGLSKVDKVQWPVGAFYSGNVKGHFLWAWDKEHAETIKEFILSISRDYRQFKYSSSLYHLPENFKLAKNRDACLKTLDRMISRKSK